jgi:predicted MFS family arabinose efflux permease
MIGAAIAVWIGLRGTFAATALLFVVVAVVALIYMPDESIPESSTFQPAAAGD